MPTGVDLSGRLAINPGDKEGYSNPMRFESADRAYVGKKCFGSNGFTRFLEFKDGQTSTPYYTLFENKNNYVKFRCLDNVPSNTNAQLVGYLGIQPKCKNRQITFRFKGLFSAFTYGTRLMIWRNIHYVSSRYIAEKQYYWTSERFDEINALSLTTANNFLLSQTIFNASSLYDQEGAIFNDIDYDEDNEQGFELSAEITIDLEPRACPHMFCLSATNDDFANFPGGYIDAEVILSE